MESYFDAVLMLLLLSSIGVNYVILCKVQYLEVVMDDAVKEHSEVVNNLVENFGEVDDKIVALSNQIDRSMLALRDTLEPTKPMKSNNWDSVREAFKGPSRIEINERN